MNYTIHQLKVFLKVVETKSITKAAVELFMTQPAVSIQLKNFQDQFPVALTEVIGRQLYITEFGEQIALLAEKAVAELDDIQYKTKEYLGVLSGKLKISSVSTGKYIVPYFLSGFLEKNSGVDLQLDVTNKSKVIESLKRNEIDFALISTMPNDMEVEELKLVENKLYLVGKDVDFNEKKPLIYREEGSATRQAMEKYFKNPKQRKKLELTSNEAVKQAVIAGLGYSILPLIGIKNAVLTNEIHIIPQPDLPIITTWRIIWLKGKNLSPVSKAYLEFLEDYKNQIINEHFNWFNDMEL